MDLHSLFKYSAARHEDFWQIQFEMEVELCNFQQHTEVRWLSIGPAIKRILEQYEVITHFVVEVMEDSKKVPKSVNFKTVHMMLATKEKASTRVSLEFLSDIVPMFEQLLLVFQKASPVVHIMYDSLCDILLKLMRRFMKEHAIEKRYGCDLASVECKDVKLVMGSDIRRALKELTPDQLYLGYIHSSVQQLQSFSRNFLWKMACCSSWDVSIPQKKKNKNKTETLTVTSIESLAGVLQPKLSASEVVDEWKLFEVDNDLPNYDRQEWIEQYWNRAFQLQSSDGQLKYKLLPTIIKSALILGQTNAESEHSLSVSARVVTKERTLLGEKIIVGLHVVKEAVRFFDPISNQVEKINITEELKRSVKFAHAAYKEHLEKGREEKETKREEAQKKKIAEKTQRERERLTKKKESLAKSEESLNEQEQKARQELGVADELLKDAT